MKTKRVKIDKFNDRAVRGNPNRRALGKGYRTLPYDLPIFLEVDRHLAPTKRKDMDKVDELVGWTMEVDAFTIGAKVAIKIGRKKKKLEVWVDGKRVAEVHQRPNPGMHPPVTAPDEDEEVIDDEELEG